MELENGLIAAYSLDGNGGGKSLSWDEIHSLDSKQGFTWIHLDITQQYVRHWITETGNFDDVVAEALLAEETRPRSTEMKNGLLVMLRGVNMNPGSDPEDMVAIRIWIEDNRVITTRKRKLLSIDDIRERISRNEGPKTPGDLLVMLSDRMVARASGVIDDIDEEVDRLENDVVESENPRLRHELAELRTQVISLRRYLAPQREAMIRLSHEKIKWLSESDRIRLREVSDSIIRYVEDLDAVRERAAVVQEELANRLSEQMNKRMYTLSLVAGVFLPLGFLTGLLGINVGGIPGAENPFGFEWVIGVLIVLVILQIWVFKRQRWL